MLTPLVRLLLSVLILLAAASASAASTQASDPVLLSKQVSPRQIGTYMEYLVDPEGRYSFDQIMARNDWETSKVDNPSFGFTSQVYWLRFDLRNDTAKTATRLLEIAYPLLDHLDIWLSNSSTGDSNFSNSNTRLLKLGDKQPFAQRPYQHPHFIVPLDLQAGSTTHIVMRVQTTSNMFIPTTLWQASDFHSYDQNQKLLTGIYVGIVVAMVLYNLFLLVSLRERTTAYYIFWVTGMSLFILSYSGIAFAYLWPNALHWNDQAVIFFLASALFFGALFTNDFLEIQTNSSWLVRFGVQAFAFSGLVCMLLSFVLPYALAIRLIIAGIVIACSCAIGISLIRVREGFIPARLYLASWSFVLIGGLILAASKFRLIESNSFTELAPQIGSVLEVLLLAFALADRINRERALREEAQREALLIQQETNAVLEQRVRERTQELEAANERLQEISTTDALTGVRNRRFFDEIMVQETKRSLRSGDPFGLLIIDVDHFKQVNDQYGHQVGDDCLRQIAQVLRNSIRRECDTIARYGGEEFCVLLPNTSSGGVKHVAESLRRAVAMQPMLIDGTVHSITVSIGAVAATPTRVGDHELYVASADAALYDAKHNGRNRVEFCNELKRG